MTKASLFEGIDQAQTAAGRIFRSATGMNLLRFRILELIVENPGCAFSKLIKEVENIGSTNLCFYHVKALLKDDYVAQGHPEESSDGRQVYYWPTEKGRAKLIKSAGDIEKASKRLQQEPAIAKAGIRFEEART